jgi:hypothetical protein
MDILQESDSGVGSSALGVAGAAVAQEQARAEAEAESTRQVEMARRALAAEALQTLRRLIRTLWDRILSEASAAEEVSTDRIALGRGLIGWAVTHEYVPQGSFPQSGWDVVAGAKIYISQATGREGYPGRSACLWYVALGEQADYRWVEVPYMMNLVSSPPVNPFAIDDLVDADLAASRITHAYQLAAQPSPIDDEEAEDFLRRWMDRLAKASLGNLQHPPRLPE